MTSSLPLPDPSTHGTGWQITGQMEQQKIDGAGTFQDGIVVSFVTQSGQPGTVFVPRAQFTPANVHAAVTSQARVMDQITGLTSDSYPTGNGG